LNDLSIKFDNSKICHIIEQSIKIIRKKIMAKYRTKLGFALENNTVHHQALDRYLNQHVTNSVDLFDEELINDLSLFLDNSLAKNTPTPNINKLHNLIMLEKLFKEHSRNSPNDYIKSKWRALRVKYFRSQILILKIAIKSPAISANEWLALTKLASLKIIAPPKGALATRQIEKESLRLQVNQQYSIHLLTDAIKSGNINKVTTACCLFLKQAIYADKHMPVYAEDMEQLQAVLDSLSRRVRTEHMRNIIVLFKKLHKLLTNGFAARLKCWRSSIDEQGKAQIEDALEDTVSLAQLQHKLEKNLPANDYIRSLISKHLTPALQGIRANHKKATGVSGAGAAPHGAGSAEPANGMAAPQPTAPPAPPAESKATGLGPGAGCPAPTAPPATKISTAQQIAAGLGPGAGCPAPTAPPATKTSTAQQIAAGLGPGAGCPTPTAPPATKAPTVTGSSTAVLSALAAQSATENGKPVALQPTSELPPENSALAEKKLDALISALPEAPVITIDPPANDTEITQGTPIATPLPEEDEIHENKLIAAI
jgi:hypothetical protein